MTKTLYEKVSDIADGLADEVLVRIHDLPSRELAQLFRDSIQLKRDLQKDEDQIALQQGALVSNLAERRRLDLELKPQSVTDLLK